MEQTTALATRLFGTRPESRTSNGLYTVSDCDDVVYVNAGATIHAITLADPDDPGAGLTVLRSFDTTAIFEPFSFPGYPAAVRLIGMNLTYGGYLAIGAFGQLCVIDREFREPAQVHTFEAGQLLSNSFSIDEHGGIHVATGALAPGQAGIMHKLVWTRKQLSADQADGAWTAEYPGGSWAPAVKVGTGTGSTPTLVGFGPGADHLVVITDGRYRMHLTAFWRDDLPAGATSRIAGTIAVTCGLPGDVAWIQSGRSPRSGPGNEGCSTSPGAIWPQRHARHTVWGSLERSSPPQRLTSRCHGHYLYLYCCLPQFLIAKGPSTNAHSHAADRVCLPCSSAEP